MKHIFCLSVLTCFDSLYFRTDDLKFGDLVGEDKYGNKYYENNMYFYGKLCCNCVY